MVGKLLASAGWDKKVRIWDTSDWTLVQVLSSPDHDRISMGKVRSVTFSPDGRLLASGSGDGTVRIWGTSDWTEVQTLYKPQDTGSSGLLPVNAVTFSPNENLLVSINGPKRGKGIGHGWNWDNKIRIWSTETWRDVTLSWNTTEGQPLSCAAFSPNGRLLASGSGDGTVRIWSRGFYSFEWTEFQTLSGPTYHEYQELQRSLARKRGMIHHSSSGPMVYSIAFSPDGSLLASGFSDETIRIWNTSDWTEVRVLSLQRMSVKSVIFSPDGTLLASADGKTIRIWGTSDWTEVQPLSGHTHQVSSIAFSPDGRLLASGSRDETIRIWDTSDWTEVQTFSGHIHNVTSLAFSPGTQ